MDADEAPKTETTTPPPGPEATPPPNPPAPETRTESAPTNDHGERLERVETLLGSIQDTLSQLVPGSTDQTPVKVPWIYRGGRRK